MDCEDEDEDFVRKSREKKDMPPPIQREKSRKALVVGAPGPIQGSSLLSDNDDDLFKEFELSPPVKPAPKRDLNTKSKAVNTKLPSPELRITRNDSTKPSLKTSVLASEPSTSEGKSVKVVDKNICPLCEKALGHLNSERQLLHINTCLDGQELKSKFETAKKKYDATIDCPLCGEPQADGPYRAAHVKRCAKTHGVSAANILKLMDTQRIVTESRRSRQLAHTKAPLPQFKAVKPAPLKGAPKSLDDEQILLAKALSESVQPQTLPPDQNPEFLAPRTTIADLDDPFETRKGLIASPAYTVVSEASRRQRKRRSYDIVAFAPDACRCRHIDAAHKRFLECFQLKRRGSRVPLSTVTNQRSKRAERFSAHLMVFMEKLARLERLSGELRPLADLCVFNPAPLRINCAGGAQIECVREIVARRTKLLKQKKLGPEESDVELEFPLDIAKEWLRYVYSARIEWTGDQNAKMGSLAEVYGPEDLARICQLRAGKAVEEESAAKLVEREKSDQVATALSPVKEVTPNSGDDVGKEQLLNEGMPGDSKEAVTVEKEDIGMLLRDQPDPLTRESGADGVEGEALRSERTVSTVETVDWEDPFMGLSSCEKSSSEAGDRQDADQMDTKGAGLEASKSAVPSASTSAPAKDMNEESSTRKKDSFDDSITLNTQKKSECAKTQIPSQRSQSPDLFDDTDDEIMVCSPPVPSGDQARTAGREVVPPSQSLPTEVTAPVVQDVNEHQERLAVDKEVEVRGTAPWSPTRQMDSFFTPPSKRTALQVRQGANEGNIKESEGLPKTKPTGTVEERRTPTSEFRRYQSDSVLLQPSTTSVMRTTDTVTTTVASRAAANSPFSDGSVIVLGDTPSPDPINMRRNFEGETPKSTSKRRSSGSGGRAGRASREGPEESPDQRRQREKAGERPSSRSSGTETSALRRSARIRASRSPTVASPMASSRDANEERMAARDENPARQEPTTTTSSSSLEDVTYVVTRAPNNVLGSTVSSNEHQVIHLSDDEELRERREYDDVTPSCQTRRTSFTQPTTVMGNTVAGAGTRRTSQKVKSPEHMPMNYEPPAFTSFDFGFEDDNLPPGAVMCFDPEEEARRSLGRRTSSQVDFAKVSDPLLHTAGPSYCSGVLSQCHSIARDEQPIDSFDLSPDFGSRRAPLQAKTVVANNVKPSAAPRKRAQTAQDYSFCGAEPVAHSTPIASLKAKKPRFASNVKVLKTDAVTPMPNYNDLDDQSLKTELARRGLRPMGRKRAVAILSQIYERTHPVVDPVAAEHASGSTVSEPPKVTSKQAPKKQLDVKSAESEKDQEAQEGDSGTDGDADKTLNESFREDNLEESTVFEGDLPKDIEGMKQTFLAWLRQPENKEIYLHVLTLKPVSFEEMYVRARRSTHAVSKLSKKALMEIMDRLHIFFSLPQNGHRR